MSAPSFALTAVEKKEATNPLGLVRIDHIQLTGSIGKLEGLYRRMGFARVASGAVPGGRCIHLKQQRMDILVFECDGTHPAGRYFKAHDEGACALNFEVEDLDKAMAEARARGAKILLEPEFHTLGGGTLRFAAGAHLRPRLQS